MDTLVSYIQKKMVRISLCVISLSLNFLCSCIDYNEAIVHKEIIAPGMSYIRYCAIIPPLVIHVITIEPSSYSVALIPSLGQREEVSLIAHRAGAAIAINGANYRRGGKYNGNRVNLCYINNSVLADPCCWRGSLAWIENQKEWIVDTITSSVSLIIGGQEFPVHGINQPRGDGQNMIHSMHDERCRYHNPGRNIVISQGKVTSIENENDPSSVPNDGFIYQTDAIEGIESGLDVFFSYSLKTINNRYIQPDFALGGAGLLIKNGALCTQLLEQEFEHSNPLIHTGDEIVADFKLHEQQELLIKGVHPRTAFGIDNEGVIYLVVVDGRQKSSVGMTLYDLALFMQFLGCQDALNLGGGGCSTLYCIGQILNKPSQGEERPVSEALCFFTNHIF